MLESIRRIAVLPNFRAHRLLSQGLLTASSLLAFVWLLANDLIQPIAVYLLQLYLTF